MRKEKKEISVRVFNLYNFIPPFEGVQECWCSLSITQLIPTHSTVFASKEKEKYMNKKSFLKKKNILIIKLKGMKVTEKIFFFFMSTLKYVVGLHAYSFCVFLIYLFYLLFYFKFSLLNIICCCFFYI